MTRTIYLVLGCLPGRPGTCGGLGTSEGQVGSGVQSKFLQVGKYIIIYNICMYSNI